MTTNSNATLLTVRGVAQLLAVSIRQVWRLHEQGLLPKPVRIGGSVRWRQQDLVKWLDARCPATGPDGKKGDSNPCT